MTTTWNPAWLPATAVSLLSLMLGACSTSAPDNLGPQADGTLAPCPGKPNCVVSSGPPKNDKHRIEPLPADGNQWEQLPGVLADMSGIKVEKQEENYLRATATTRVLRFVDDLEFLHKPDERIIHVRSASRIGYSDLGANRKRVEAIRARLEKARN